MDIAPSALQGRTSKLLIGSESDARKHFLPRVQKELEQAFLDGLLDKGYRPVLLKDRLSNNERFQLHALDWKTSKDVKILNSFASRLCSKHQLSSVIYAHYKVRLLDAAATDDFGEGVLHWFAADGEPLNYTVFTVSRGPPPTDGFLAAIVEYRPNLASFDLIQAATDGQTEKVKALIARGADRNADDKYGVEFGDTALFAAVLNGHSETAKVLLEWGSNISEQEDIAGLNCIIAAAWKGHTETLRVLLDFLTDVNDAWEDTNGRTPLMWAASEGHSETVSTLLDADADVDVTDHNRKTALMFGASRGHIGTVNVLLGAGGDVNSKDGAGWTPLIIAADAGHFNVVETLLNAGCRCECSCGRWLGGLDRFGEMARPDQSSRYSSH